MGQHNRPPKELRKRAQMRRVAGTPPPNMPLVAGFDYTDPANAPDNMQQYSSATYSLGSPGLVGVQQIAVLSYSLGSPNIPDYLKRVAILPET